ncbi:hypothetical protein GCM10022209_31310 [Chitinophaga oryziterrae]
MGATANDILRQTNQNNIYYGTSNDPANNQRVVQAMIKEKMAKDPAYSSGSQNSFQINKQQELFNLLKEIAGQDMNRAPGTVITPENYSSDEFGLKTKSYTDALQVLKDMLSDKRKLSVSDAYFIMENAYGDAYLTQKEFKGIIKESADFIREWILQRNLNIKDNTVINYGVQQFMGERLNITTSKQRTDGKQSLETITHLPFKYDFNDYTGDKDYRNFSLTKCLATGTGQCNSLPAVYLSLIEALGGKAYLAIAPQHSLIKYPDKQGRMRNYEPTSHWDITNEWYLDNMFISAQAVRNGIYLNPIGGKQMIADIILQLSFGYFRKFGAADEKFIVDCINTAKPYFPKNNNLTLYFTYSNLYSYELAQVMRKNGINKLSNINQSSEAQRLYNKWLENEKIISQLGYQDQSKDMYEEMMKYHEFRNNIQQEYNFNSKEKRNLFIK